MKLLLLTAITLSLFSCTPKYLLVLKMDPSTNPPGGAYYENDTLKLKFVVTDTYIGVKFDNKTDKGIKINWDEISFSLNGKAYARVLHNLTGIRKINDVQPPTTIPPRSYIEDRLYPREKMYVASSGGAYYSVNYNFFRPQKSNENSDKYHKSKIGDKIIIHLPYYLGKNFVESNFEIEIIDVKKK